MNGPCLVARQLLRSGRAGEARALCERYGQQWRAASLFCGVNWQDTLANDGIDRAGNPFQLLWRWVCWQLAEEGFFDQVRSAVCGVLLVA